MTKRSTWPMRIEAGATRVGTATIRDDNRPSMTTAQRRIFEATGNRPQADSAFDEIADGLDAFPELQAGAAMPAKPSKYRNKKCEQDGIKFDSKREMRRWHELVQMQVRGEICNLTLQVPFELAPAVVIGGRKRPALRYFADFVYERSGERVIEDVKGRVTEGYRIKRHLMAARGLTIVEIK